MPADTVSALWDAGGIALVAVAVTLLWLRLRRRRTPLPFLSAFSMWARGLPAATILEAADMAQRSGNGIPLNDLVKAYERHRESIRNPQELLLAARTDQHPSGE